MNTVENLCYTWKLSDEYPVYKHTGTILPIPTGKYMRLNFAICLHVYMFALSLDINSNYFDATYSKFEYSVLERMNLINI
jgi:hypothetical protein